MVSKKLASVTKRKKLKSVFDVFKVKQGNYVDLAWELANKYCPDLLKLNSSAGRPTKYAFMIRDALFTTVRHYMRVYKLNEDQAIKKLFDDEKLNFRPLTEDELKAEEQAKRNRAEGKPVMVYAAPSAQPILKSNWDKLISTNKREGKRRISFKTMRRRYFQEKKAYIETAISDIKRMWREHGISGLTQSLYFKAGCNYCNIDLVNKTNEEIEFILSSKELRELCAKQIDNTDFSVGGLEGDSLF